MPLTPHDAAHLAHIRATSREALRAALGPEPREVVYVGPPRHRNLGDSLIWAGTLAYLDALGHRVVMHIDQGRYRDGDLNLVSAQAVLVFQGGGNLGDVYPAEDEFRRHLITRHPRRRAVLAPQTLHYRWPEAERAALRDYLAARDLTMLLRDRRSLDRLRTEAPGLDALLCPDLAFGTTLAPDHDDDAAPALDAAPSRRPGPGALLVVARDDGEASHADQGAVGHPDWAFTPANRLRWQVALAPGRIDKRLPTGVRRVLRPWTQRAYPAVLKANLAAVRRLFAAVDAVATNRLHAHIAAVLLGIPHAVADTAYGKVSGVFQDYSGTFGTAYLSPTLAEAVSTARGLMSPGDGARAPGPAGL